ncbi:hypothetical protein EZ428_20400 [Pedobacter frigiditerrae]|uniref:Uncharacterized protein n=1 Tax=Pedobacter frigiditerrae TaxID=2530452 RepID=A0A4R0MMX9_9SPHI|nr:hypothetical protein [Pedobacter frigiditerrae]TCC88085.1 hypothetical protein EZ428_20400 [Pedobacter frigiditerrae]
MEPFNIKIRVTEKVITLTILPKDNQYKIIYFGGIIGGLKQENNNLIFIKPENIVPGSLPLYNYKQADSTASETQLRLTNEVLQDIKIEVQKTLKNLPVG